MPNNPVFIQVILPLRLEWEPYYLIEDGEPIQVGERVQVVFSGRRYIAVVSAVGVTPEEGIKIFKAQRTEHPPVGAEELAFWRSLSEYYLCEVGEVYKAVIPQQQLKTKKGAQPEECLPVSPGIPFPEKTLLLEGNSEQRTAYYPDLIRHTLAAGRSVLYLVPEIGLSHQLEEQVKALFPEALTYHSALTPARRRGVSEVVRKGGANLVLGTRSALFLPYRNLGLIIVDDEQDPSYKQDSPAPRYHAREAAILLARTQSARVVLGSANPSLESIYNADNGLFDRVRLPETAPVEQLLVNVAAEIKKKGVSGNFSLKLLAEMHRCLDAGEKILLVCRSKMAIPDYTAELESIFASRAAQIELCTPASAKGQPSGAFALVAVLQADHLLNKDDFRCDERAMQVLGQLRSRCTPNGLLVIQTFEAGHPAFGPWNADTVGRLLAERRQFGCPPYTRLLDVVVRDQNEKRLGYMSAELFQALRRALPAGISPVGPYPSPAGSDVRIIRISLPRDKALISRKRLIYSTVLDFEKALKYFTHIHLDVDPV